MIVLSVLLVVVLAVVAVLAPRARRRSLTKLESTALLIAPVPLIVSIVIPATLAWSSGFAGDANPRIRLTVVGTVLSAIVATACALVGRRRRDRSGASSGALVVAAIVASVPVLLYGVVLMVWLLESTLAALRGG